MGRKEGERITVVWNRLVKVTNKTTKNLNRAGEERESNVVCNSAAISWRQKRRREEKRERMASRGWSVRREESCVVRIRRAFFQIIVINETALSMTESIHINWEIVVLRREEEE